MCIVQQQQQQQQQQQHTERRQSINPSLDEAEHWFLKNPPPNPLCLFDSEEDGKQCGKCQNIPCKANLRFQETHLTEAPRNCNLLPQELEEHKTLKNMSAAFLINGKWVCHSEEKVLHRVSPWVRIRRRQECKHVLNATQSPWKG